MHKFHGEVCDGLFFETLSTKKIFIGSFIPANSLAFVINFSERISSFAPRMTLDFILQWSIGFSKATSVEKLSCLQYISPWIRNMAMFTDPSNAHFDEPRVRDCIRIFVDITIQEPEVKKH